MAHWALVIYLIGGAYNNATVASVPGFDTPELCQLAGDHLIVRGVPVRVWSCVQTDGSKLVPLPFKDGAP
jgi:hypothetical protein